MVTVTVKQAEAQIGKLLKRVADGEEILITEGDAPIARLVKPEPATDVSAHSRPPRQPGNARGVVLYMSDDFDAPLEDFAEYS